MSFSLTSNGWVSFSFPLKKGTFPPTPIRVTERPLLKHRNFSVVIGGAGEPMAKGGTKSTQCCGNSVGDAGASLRTNEAFGFASPSPKISDSNPDSNPPHSSLPLYIYKGIISRHQFESYSAPQPTKPSTEKCGRREIGR